jgi:hypothetical protein
LYMYKEKQIWHPRHKYIYERSLSWFATNISMSDHCPGLLQIYPWSTRTVIAHGYVCNKPRQLSLMDIFVTNQDMIAHGYICYKPGQWSLMDIFVPNQESDRSWTYL